jgi:dTDP-4-amino-4,6-dideoxygalactose transaminase
MTFEKISEFESALAKFTGAPYAVMTDCCTHAIELCLRYDNIQRVTFPAHTYLSIPMTMHKLGITYNYSDKLWTGEYQFIGTRVWDSARLLKQDMYREGQLQCLSFGYGKPLEIGRGGAILTDDIEAYKVLKHQCYDGRDLSITPWEDQKVFHIGYHYKPTIEEAVRGLELLPNVDQEPKYKEYPDLREITIIS